MDLNIMILAIIFTSFSTFVYRFFGALTSEKVKARSRTFEWFNCVAYATLAALVARMVVFPAGVLSEADLIIRILVLIVCISIFLLSKKNLVLPTIISAILLTVLTSV